MDEIIKFDPSVEELNKIVAVTSKITAPDLSDDTQVALVHDTRISLRDARVKIEKAGKQYRADALAYQKKVIAREKELIAIIEPEEIRLKALEEEATRLRERAAREALLPMRREQLVPFGKKCDVCNGDGYTAEHDLPSRHGEDGECISCPVQVGCEKCLGGGQVIGISDEELLDLDNDGFISYLNQVTSEKNERDRQAIEAEKARLAHEKELAEAAEKAKIAERERIEAQQRADEARRVNEAAQAKIEAERVAQKVIDDAKAEAERIAQEARDKAAQERAQEEARKHEQFAREQQARDEAAKKEAQEKFKVWAMKYGYDQSDDFETRHTPAGIELWRRVGIYTDL